tara:strand:+ start:78631 stop:78852 length:222 start_codon:yes stop_codon:yes gene_type:complete
MSSLLCAKTEFCSLPVTQCLKLLADYRTSSLMIDQSRSQLPRERLIDRCQVEGACRNPIDRCLRRIEARWKVR